MRSTALFLCVAGLLSGLVVTGCAKKKEAAAPVPTVQFAVAVQRDVPVFTEVVGQTRGAQEVEIRARVEGFIESVDFAEGTFVKKGQLLFTIDDRPFRAAAAQAQGQLAEAEAQLIKAKQDVGRYGPLAEKNAIPRQDYETALAYEQAARAAVEAARATLESAEINLGYTRVTAPVAGLAGIALVKEGNLVGRGESTLLTSISDTDPIHVRFAIAERDYLTLARKVIEQKAAGARTEPRTNLQMVLADGSVYPHPGRVAFTDRNVDPTTGTLLVEAAFPNPEKLVRPGQFATVRAPVEMRRGAILVPQRAVQERQAVFNVAVVAPGDTIQVRRVTPGPRVDKLWVIDEGIAAGDRVVVEGVQKVRPGMKVKPVAAVIPDSASGAAPGAGGPAAAGG